MSAAPLATTSILAPLRGRAVPLSAVPDPVFAEGMMGPGAAIEPPHEVLDVVAPVSGTLAKVFPHAFVIVTPAGFGVLVHLGIDTVGLDGAGFTLHVTQGDEIAVGDPVVTWDVPSALAAGLSVSVPVALLEFTGEAGLADGVPEGSEVQPGGAFLTLRG